MGWPRPLRYSSTSRSLLYSSMIDCPREKMGAMTKMRDWKKSEKKSLSDAQQRMEHDLVDAMNGEEGLAQEDEKWENQIIKVWQVGQDVASGVGE